MFKVYLSIHPSTYPRSGRGGSRPTRVFQTSILSYTFHLLLGEPQGSSRQAGLCNSSSKSCSYLGAFTQKNVAGTPLKESVLEASRSGARTTSIASLLTPRSCGSESELSLDVWGPHHISMAKPSHPLELMTMKKVGLYLTSTHCLVFHFQTTCPSPASSSIHQV